MLLRRNKLDALERKTTTTTTICVAALLVNKSSLVIIEFPWEVGCVVVVRLNGEEETAAATKKASLFNLCTYVSIHSFNITQIVLYAYLVNRIYLQAAAATSKDACSTACACVLRVSSKHTFATVTTTATCRFSSPSSVRFMQCQSQRRARQQQQKQ